MKSLLRFTVDWLRVLWGALAFNLTGKTSAGAYQAFVRLFCRTGGKSNDLMSAVITRASPPYDFSEPKGVLGKLDPTSLSAVLKQLDERGYYIFPETLPERLCHSLTDFALNYPCAVREDESGKVLAGRRIAYKEDRAAPRGIRYDFEMADVIANADVQALICDQSILAVAQAYLRARPIADVLAIWWNTALSSKPSEAAAQYFHFDLDRVKWLKFFIYLTDVGAESGPHTFVSGSHRSGAIPQSLLRQGYARLSDEDVRECFSTSAFVEFAAPRGTIIAEDTRGLHKGKIVERGDRLMLQLQFSNSLFGATYPQSSFGESITPVLTESIRRFPEVYASFTA